MKGELFHDEKWGFSRLVPWRFPSGFLWCIGGFHRWQEKNAQRETGKRKKERIFLKNFFPHNKKSPFLDGFRNFFLVPSQCYHTPYGKGMQCEFFHEKKPRPAAKKWAEKIRNWKKYDKSEFLAFEAVKYLTVKKAEKRAAGAYEPYFFSQL